MREAEPKAELLATTFKKKYVMAPREENEYSPLTPSNCHQDGLFSPTEDMAFDQLTALRADSGTGPDDVPTLILRTCARELAAPIVMLTIRILACMLWPEPWKIHWMVPLFKKNETFLSENYRGVHLTSQVSKVVERLIKQMMDLLRKDKCIRRKPVCL